MYGVISSDKICENVGVLHVIKMENDILQLMHDDDVEKLKQLYKGVSDRVPHVFNLICMYQRWTRERPKEKPKESRWKIYICGDNWDKTGTFVYITQVIR